MRIFLPLFFIMSIQCVKGQELISFEIDEGYQLGDINSQLNWETSQSGFTSIDTQLVTDEKQTDGTNALKLVFDSGFQPQSTPNIGAYYYFDAPLQNPNTSLTVSFDFFIDQSGESDYKFAFEDFNPLVNLDIFGIVCKRDGTVTVFSNSDTDGRGMVTEMRVNSNWIVGQWNTVRFEINGNNQEVFLNNVSIYSGGLARFNIPIESASFLHTNDLSNAFIDNIRINNETLSTKSNRAEPNRDFIYNTERQQLIITNEKSTKVSLYNLLGQLVFDTELNSRTTPLNISYLDNGTYILNLLSEGRILSAKFIKH